jgi:hypothetical protein
MRKIAIVIAAVTGISAVAGATYVYTTDTCLTDSCRSEKERQRQSEIDQEWQKTSENKKIKKFLPVLFQKISFPLLKSITIY